MQGKDKYSCEEHIDIAFDDFLIENEVSPCLQDENDNKCDYCDDKAKYRLSQCGIEEN